MTGPLLVGFIVAMSAGVWMTFGGGFRGSLVLLAIAEAFVLAATALTTLAPEAGWGGPGGAVEATLTPYGIAVAVGWVGGAAVGRAARHLVVGG
jgi:hypothetical protein